MTNKILGKGLFLIGIFVMLVHSTMPFLWALLGFSAPYPLASNSGIINSLSPFAPPIGAVLLAVGGIIYGLKTKKQQ